MKQKTYLAALVGALLPMSVTAQSLQGMVVDQSGKPVAGAKIKVDGTSFNTISDRNGAFTFKGLPSEDAELHVSAPGYAHLHQDIDLSKNVNADFTFVLLPTAFEVIDIVATPVHMSVMESAAPVSVLAGETLRRQQAATLGDSLEFLAGVQTNFHGNVASTPVIRGLTGPRVLIAQNGLDVNDVSRVGPDHAVATEASTAQQIEVLRGPATLFYGSGAIGGVVNVVDGRVPTDATTRGEWLLETDSVNNQKLGSFNVTTGSDRVAVYADGFWREADDYDIPGPAEIDDPNSPDVVENSAEESKGFTLGASYLLDNGYIGVAVEQFDRQYGIPGHTHEHGGEDAHSDDAHDHSHEHDEHAHDDHGDDEMVFADLQQTRLQLQSELNFSGSWLRQIQTRAALTDYEHAEIEHGMVGTVFKNSAEEIRIDVLHNPIAGWNGGVSLHYKSSNVEADGSEAFTPSSEMKTFALAVMEEKHVGDFLFQLGARVERVTLDAGDVRLPELAVHGDDNTDHSDHDHDHDHSYSEPSVTRRFSSDMEFTPVSVSAGVVWDVTEGYNLGLSLSRAQRAPSPQELLSFGPHIGTRTYEVGALFALHDEGEGEHIGLSEEMIDLETSNNIDLTFRKTEGDVGFIFNAFYNQVDNYYYQVATGLFGDDGHDHGGHDHGGEHDHSGELPVFLFRTDDVILHGFEAQVAWQVNSEFKASFFSDYVRARLQDGGDLPRTPPMRFGGQLSYQLDQMGAFLDVIHYREQDRIAPEETVTDGYTMVDVNVTYDFRLMEQDLSAYFRVSNLTDTEARVHTSFLKDIAPRPGRSIAVGLRGYF